MPKAIKNEIALSGIANRYFTLRNPNDTSNESVLAFLYWGFLMPVRYFDASETEQLVNILNDSSSYISGQMATVSFDEKLYFLDSMGDITMITRLGQDGQTYTSPTKRRLYLRLDIKPAFIADIQYEIEENIKV